MVAPVLEAATAADLWGLGWAQLGVCLCVCVCGPLAPRTKWSGTDSGRKGAEKCFTPCVIKGSGYLPPVRNGMCSRESQRPARFRAQTKTPFSGHRSSRPGPSSKHSCRTGVSFTFGWRLFCLSCVEHVCNLWIVFRAV